MAGSSTRYMRSATPSYTASPMRLCITAINKRADRPTHVAARQPNLRSRLEWLIARGIIRQEAAPQWDAIRELRNEGSHADFAHLAMPMDALRSLELLAAEINALFQQ